MGDKVVAMNAPAVSAAVLFEDSGHLKADDKDGQARAQERQMRRKSTNKFTIVLVTISDPREADPGESLPCLQTHPT